MPTRPEKHQKVQLWRVTLTCKEAIKLLNALKKLEKGLAAKQGRSGPKSSLVTVVRAEEDVVVLRWDPPRTYDAVKAFLSKHLQKHVFQLAKEGDNEKEDKKEDDKKEDTKEDKNVAGSAASAASVGQRLSGRHLALKLQALLQCHPPSEDSEPTTGLHVFEDLIVKP